MHGSTGHGVRSEVQPGDHQYLHGRRQEKRPHRKPGSGIIRRQTPSYGTKGAISLTPYAQIPPRLQRSANRPWEAIESAANPIGRPGERPHLLRLVDFLLRGGARPCGIDSQELETLPQGANAVKVRFFEDLKQQLSLSEGRQISLDLR